MGFKKGDPNINRNGRPKNAEIDKLRRALQNEGDKKGKDFWEEVAKKAFVNEKIMIAVLKKFVPDMRHSEIDADLKTTVSMPMITIDGKPLEFKIGDKADNVESNTSEDTPSS